jgi:hypothetical protein
MKNSAILYLYAQRSKIKIDPPYQREGDIWPIYKKQLLIDSIINEFDVPKIYFHDLRDYNGDKKYDYAIIDGRQRLEAIWGFIEGDFSLSEEFEYLLDEEVKAAGLTYSELASKYPKIKQLLDSNSLTVMIVQTDEVDLIEEMFSRLNEAVPLNAAEKRNALGGPLPKLVREISKLKFFTKNIKISNKRYQHIDLASKMLYLHHKKKILDTKKVYLDMFFKDNKRSKKEVFRKDIRGVSGILESMSKVFMKNDPLLRSSGMVMLYYFLFKREADGGWGKKITRSLLIKFDELRIKNRKIAENDIANANYDLLEFDRLTQTPNDQYAISFRLNVLVKFVEDSIAN